MFRLFVAITLPDPVKAQLTQLHYGLPGARWVEPANMHLNLRFIGEVDSGVFNDVRASLAEVEVPSFTLSLKGTGFFPPKQHPHTLWAGLEKSEPLGILHRRVEASLARAGIARDSRKFSPHVTVAHLSASPDTRVATWLSANGLFRSDPFAVGSFCLYSSALTNHGADYQIEELYELAAGEELQA
jgi:RNA 2',3'-cyclic 3'-phosphodiesterase